MTMFTIFNQSRNILDHDNEDNTNQINQINIWNFHDALALSTLKKLIKKCWYLLSIQVMPPDRVPFLQNWSSYHIF